MNGRHAKLDVIVPARVAKLTKYVRGKVHLRLSSMSVHNRRDENRISFHYLLHLQQWYRTSDSVSRKICNRSCDLAGHVGRESGARDSNECHRAPAFRANGSDQVENLIESQRPLLQVRSLHQNCKAAESMLDGRVTADRKDLDFDAGELKMSGT